MPDRIVARTISERKRTGPTNAKSPPLGRSKCDGRRWAGCAIFRILLVASDLFSRGVRRRCARRRRRLPFMGRLPCSCTRHQRQEMNMPEKYTPFPQSRTRPSRRTNAARLGGAAPSAGHCAQVQFRERQSLVLAEDRRRAGFKTSLAGYQLRQLRHGYSPGINHEAPDPEASIRVALAAFNARAAMATAGRGLFRWRSGRRFEIHHNSFELDSAMATNSGWSLPVANARFSSLIFMKLASRLVG